MDYPIYFTIRQILMSLLLFLGLHMITMSLPEHMRSGLYKRSLRIMGIAFLIVPISCFISTRHNQFDLDALISPAINLTAYFATFILMALAFHSMLGKNFNRLVYKLSFAAIVIYPLHYGLALLVEERS